MTPAPLTPDTPSIEKDLVKSVIRLPVVLALLSFVASAGGAVGVSYATFSTHADVEARVEKAVAAHSEHPHSNPGLMEQLKEIRDDLREIRKNLGAIKTDLEVLKARPKKAPDLD